MGRRFIGRLVCGIYPFLDLDSLREKSVGAKIVWIVLMMILGFFTGSVYLLKAAYESKGDRRVFLMGK